MAADPGVPVGPAGNQAEAGTGGPTRSQDEIALELMKFIAITTGYGKSGGSSAGFSGKPVTHSPEEYADSLIQLFERCRDIVKRGR